MCCSRCNISWKSIILRLLLLWIYTICIKISSFCKYKSNNIFDFEEVDISGSFLRNTTLEMRIFSPPPKIILNKYSTLDLDESANNYDSIMIPFSMSLIDGIYDGDIWKWETVITEVLGGNASASLTLYVSLSLYISLTLSLILLSFSLSFSHLLSLTLSYSLTLSHTHIHSHTHSPTYSLTHSISLSLPSQVRLSHRMLHRPLLWIQI